MGSFKRFLCLRKAHVLSLLYLILYTYKLSLFDIKTLKGLNSFNVLNKNRYLSYNDYKCKKNK